VHSGRLLVDGPIDLPDGSKVALSVVEDGDELDDEDRARLHEAIRAGQAELDRGEGGRRGHRQAPRRLMPDYQVRLAPRAQSQIDEVTAWWKASCTSCAIRRKPRIARMISKSLNSTCRRKAGLCRMSVLGDVEPHIRERLVVTALAAGRGRRRSSARLNQLGGDRVGCFCRAVVPEYFGLQHGGVPAENYLESVYRRH
jgi:hypothetical protein